MNADLHELPYAHRSSVDFHLISVWIVGLSDERINDKTNK